MKKLFLLAAGLVFCASTYAQGTITFANDSSTLVVTNDLQGHIGAAQSSSGVRVQLFYLPKNSSIAPVGDPNQNTSWEACGTAIGFTPAPGRFNGGTKTTGSDVAGGTSAWFEVRGWTGGYADWNSAYAAYLNGTPGVFVNVSQVWENPVGNPNSTPAVNPASMVLGPGGFNGLNLVQVPEPSMIALAGLGAASLLLFRRCK